MGWWRLFFSFRGRINRAKYWLALAIYVLLGFVPWLGAWALGWLGIVQVDIGGAAAFRALNTASNYVLWFSCLAVGVKRLHDRDKSGWWLLVVYLAPVAGFVLVYYVGALNSLLSGMVLRLGILAEFALIVWFFVELGCLPGTRGYNRYGRNPLAMA